MRFLAIDLGSSFIKGALLDLTARSFADVRRVPFPAPLPYLPPHRFEVDPRQVVAATRALIEALLAIVPDCAGLVMCSQMHSLVLMDDRGEPLSNIITWRDQRALEPHPSGSGSVFEHLRQAIGPEDRLALGNELRPGLPLGALFWMAAQGELPNGAIPVALPEFVLAQLCHALPGCEPTIAAAQGRAAHRGLALAAAGAAGANRIGLAGDSRYSPAGWRVARCGTGVAVLSGDRRSTVCTTGRGFGARRALVEH
jgi:FGGY family of carbohydrate kinases, N-terminal domain